MASSCPDRANVHSPPNRSSPFSLTHHLPFSLYMSAHPARNNVSAADRLHWCYRRAALARCLLRTHDPVAEAEAVWGQQTGLHATLWTDQLRTVTRLLDRIGVTTITDRFWSSADGVDIRNTLEELEQFATTMARAELAMSYSTAGPAHMMQQLRQRVSSDAMALADRQAAAQVDRLLPPFEHLVPARLTTEQLVEFCLCEQWAKYLHQLYCEEARQLRSSRCTVRAECRSQSIRAPVSPADMLSRA